MNHFAERRGSKLPSPTLPGKILGRSAKDQKIPMATEQHARIGREKEGVSSYIKMVLKLMRDPFKSDVSKRKLQRPSRSFRAPRRESSSPPFGTATCFLYLCGFTNDILDHSLIHHVFIWNSCSKKKKKPRKARLS